MSRILISGTLAYDDIGTFTTPLTAVTRNIKLDRLDRAFGGCAMNIAYNLAGLGDEPVPFVYTGDDYSGAYAHHVARCGISEAGIFSIPGTPCARGIVLTGIDGVQFTAFYPGPSGLERWAGDLEQVIAGEPLEAVIIAPDLPEKMAGCAMRLAHLPRRVWCPGQYAELLDRDTVLAVLEACSLLVVNRHEWQALCDRASAEAIRERVERIVITDGPRPVELLPDGTRITVPAAAAAATIDPTGCGDAFVAALTGSLVHGAGLAAAVEAGIGLAGRCLASRGAQTHPVRSNDDFRSR
ncbi:MAG: PfkB family carbohydrate kinase [Gammaproteobacteria bacterium]|nr:PfkB family carbohydrate kinase [Gammaproteobacteria bacterium]